MLTHQRRNRNNTKEPQGSFFDNMKTQVGVKAIILNKKTGHFLVLRRNSGAYENAEKEWDIPGGRIDFGEEPIDGLMREIYEEVGVDLNSHAMIDGKLRILIAQNIVANVDRHIVRITYYVEVERELRVALSGEYTEYVWLPCEENPDFHPLLNSAIKEI